MPLRRVAVQKPGPQLDALGSGWPRELDAHKRHDTLDVGRLPGRVAGQKGQPMALAQCLPQHLAPGAALVVQQGVKAGPVERGVLQPGLSYDQVHGGFEGQVLGMQ